VPVIVALFLFSCVKSNTDLDRKTTPEVKESYNALRSLHTSLYVCQRDSIYFFNYQTRNDSLDFMVWQEKRYTLREEFNSDFSVASPTVYCYKNFFVLLFHLDDYNSSSIEPLLICILPRSKKSIPLFYTSCEFFDTIDDYLAVRGKRMNLYTCSLKGHISGSHFYEISLNKIVNGKSSTEIFIYDKNISNKELKSIVKEKLVVGQTCVIKV